MKKISFKNLNFEIKDILEREDLKTIFGGYDDPSYCMGGSSMPSCSQDSDCPTYCPRCRKVGGSPPGFNQKICYYN